MLIFALRRAGLATVLGLAAATLRAGHHHGVNVSIRGGHDPQRCDQIAVDIDGRPAERAEQRLILAAAADAPLRIRVPEHSGVRVRGADRADFEVVLCKAAPSRGALDSIAVSRAGGVLGVDGPPGDDWVGYLLIVAPRAAALDVTATNGPVGLAGLSGRVTVRSENGPIEIRDSSGDIDVEAQNGPIEFRGDGGHLRLHTQNGPIGVALTESVWKGQGLEARAVNGPLHLSIPPGYRSAARVESLGHSPFRCRGEACAAARRSWDDRDRRLFELGDGPAVVRLSTENGPVAISTGRVSDEDEDD